MFAQFSLILTAFSALISTPGFTTNQLVQSQALALIPQIETIGNELQTQIDTLATTTMPVYNPPAIGGAAEPVYVAPVEVTASVPPNCTVNVTSDVDSPYSGTVSWTSNVDTTGQLTVGQYFGCGEGCSQLKMVPPARNGQVSGTSGSQHVLFGSGINFWYPLKDNNTKVELNIGGATCDDFVPAK